MIGALLKIQCTSLLNHAHTTRKDFWQTSMEKDKVGMWRGCVECKAASKCECRIYISGSEDGDTPASPAMKKQFEEFLIKTCPFCEVSLLKFYKEEKNNEGEKCHKQRVRNG